MGRFEQERDYEADGKAVRKEGKNASELFLFARDYRAGGCRHIKRLWRKLGLM